MGSRPELFRFLDDLVGSRLSGSRWLVRAVLAAVLLVAVDLAVRGLVPPPDFEARYALPYNGLMHLRAFIDHVRARADAGRGVVVFLGDSSARASIPAGSANLPGLYEALLKSDPARRDRDVAVYNFSVAGLDAASKFYIARELAGHVAAVILGVNMRGFATGPRRTVPYPELWFELKPELIPEDRAHLAAAPAEGELSRLSRLDNALEEELGTACALWGRRIELKDLGLRWFHPRQWLAGALAADAAARGKSRAGPRTVWDGPLAGFPPALRDRWMASYAASFEARPAGSDSADLYFTERTFALAGGGRTRIIAYAVPYSRWLNARWRFLDERVYAADMRAIRMLVRGSRGVLFLDYNDPSGAFDPVPGDRYVQAFEHWTIDANSAFARRLYRDTRKAVLGAMP